jgi:hypothetical protein
VFSQSSEVYILRKTKDDILEIREHLNNLLYMSNMLGGISAMDGAEDVERHAIMLDEFKGTMGIIQNNLTQIMSLASDAISSIDKEASIIVKKNATKGTTKILSTNESELDDFLEGIAVKTA